MPLSVKDAFFQREANAAREKNDRLVAAIDAALVNPLSDGAARLQVSTDEEEEFILRTYLPLGYAVTVEQQEGFCRIIKVDYPPVTMDQK